MHPGDLVWLASVCAGAEQQKSPVRNEVSCGMCCSLRLLHASACEAQDARRDCSSRSIMTAVSTPCTVIPCLLA